MSIEIENITEIVTGRDPRKFHWGIFTGGSFVLDSSRVFMWFESQAELSSHLVHGLPDGYEFDDDYLAEYQKRVMPLAMRVEKEGLSAELLAEVNATIKADMKIDWWGGFGELVKNESDFARKISEGFLDEKEAGRPLLVEELDEFIDYLKTCGC